MNGRGFDGIESMAVGTFPLSPWAECLRASCLEYCAPLIADWTSHTFPPLNTATLSLVSDNC